MSTYNTAEARKAYPECNFPDNPPHGCKTISPDMVLERDGKFYIGQEYFEYDAVYEEWSGPFTENIQTEAMTEEYAKALLQKQHDVGTFTTL